MMGPVVIGEAASQLNVLLDLLSDPKKCAAQIAELQSLAKGATDAQAVNQAILDETKQQAEQANADRLAAETAQAAADAMMVKVSAEREASDQTLADAKALRDQAKEDAAALDKAEKEYQANLAALVAREDAIAKREHDLSDMEAVIAAKEEELTSKLAQLKAITG